MDPYIILIGGGVLSALVGLLGIGITRRENTPIVGLLNDDELKSYRIQRLMTEGISFCTLGKHDFRPGPGSSTTVCEECLPPATAVGKWEPHTAPAHPVQRLNFGRAYQPLNWLYEQEEERE